MLSPHEAQSYEQQSIRRTLCAGCTKELTPEETYACTECVDEWLISIKCNQKPKESSDD
ncbi:NinF family protein [Enterobacter hormaechei]|nr:NinF family protein [Enterobacter hormaechei]